MRTESRIFFGVTVFFVVIGLIYWFWAYEDAGAVMLGGCAGLGLLAGGYLYLWSRRIPPRPQDRDDATLAEGAGRVDTFPTTSVWPIAIAFGATMLATGLVFGLAVVLLGGGLLVIAVTGMVLESRGRAKAGHEG
jgi:uncharacterized iron-regulated membrane protein